MNLSAICIYSMLTSVSSGQNVDTLTIKEVHSKYDSTLYRRIVHFDPKAHLYHVTDTFLSGQIALRGDYLTIIPNVKEEFWNFHKSHVKHGYFRKWYDNGQLEWEGRFDNGLIQGKVTSWHRDGRLHFTGEYVRGMQNGSFAFYHENGGLHYQGEFENGRIIRPTKARYDYLTYLPKGYDHSSSAKWPAIIFLHGGSSRGNELKRVRANGIPDRLERGKNIPFVVIAPQCPVDKRWETDEWFDTLYAEITSRYRIDKDRIYLTGLSLGGSGTWYLAMKYPGIFAAIAPISGKTTHMQFIPDGTCKLSAIPIWILHSKDDEIVDVEETNRIVERLDKCNVHYSLTLSEGQNHWQTSWEVYAGDRIYDWFLSYRRQRTD